MADIKKKVDESWKDKVESEKLDTEHEQESGAPETVDTAQEQESPDTRSQDTQSADAQSAGEPAGFPPMQAGFITLIAELAMQASLFMGEIPDPQTNEPIEDLNRAKYLIDELGMLEEKTKGNLTPDEEDALKNVLYELRMAFVAKAPKH